MGVLLNIIAFLDKLSGRLREKLSGLRRFMPAWVLKLKARFQGRKPSRVSKFFAAIGNNRFVRSRFVRVPLKYLATGVVRTMAALFTFFTLAACMGALMLGMVLVLFGHDLPSHSDLLWGTGVWAFC